MAERTLLFLGGNGYLGSHVIEKIFEKIQNLSSDGSTIKLVSISHGSNTIDRWRNADRVKHIINHTIIWDRNKRPLSECQEAMDYDFGNVFMVLDFSSFRGDQMRDALQFMRRKLGSPFYLYISTDSCYEVSVRPPPNGVWPLHREEDSGRPSSDEEIDRMKQWDEYAHHKMAAEEILLAEHGEINFYAPRFCDILGPRDNWEDQWWRYQTWMQIATQLNVIKPVPLPTWMATKPISCGFVLDVARMIAEVFFAVATCSGNTANLPFANNVYNFGGPTPITIPELLSVTSECIGHKCDDISKFVAFVPDETPVPVDFDLYIKANEHFRFSLQRILYPVVSMVTAISVEKFQKAFPSFRFTPFKDVIKATVDFFEEATRDEQHRANFITLVNALGKDLKEQNLVREGDFAKACKTLWNIDATM